MVLGGDAPPDGTSLRAVRDLLARGKEFVPAGAEAWAGPEVAALRTAEELGLNPLVAPALRDRGYGAWAGRRFEDLLTNEPGPVQAWLAAPHNATPEGESAADLVGRVGGWLDALPSSAGGDAPARRRVVAIVHPTVVCAAVLHVLAAPPAALRQVDIRPLARVRMTCHDTTWSVAL